MHIEWIKAKEIMDDPKVFVAGVEANDIYQGKLGDCYLLSSLSAIAEHPDRVKRLFINPEANEKGCYGIALNICGDFEDFFVDDFFPTNGKRLMFCHSKSAELWAMLLEKAYARAYGGYWNIGTGGFAEDALKDLTGAPTEFDMINEETDLQSLWRRLHYCDKQHYILACGSKGSGENKTDIGIIQGHAYTIIGCHEIRGERVLEMRNPWGDHNEWKGKWGDDDNDNWDEELRETYKIEEGHDDGRFFMPYEEFPKWFDQFSICYYTDDNTLSSFTDELESNFMACYKFTVPTTGEYFVSLSQPDKRGFALINDNNEGKKIPLKK